MKKQIYCVHCGKKNDTTLKKCMKCNKSLNPKEHLFLEYIKDHIKDDLKGKTEDKIFEIIKNFIISHLYGVFVSATLIFTIVSGIISGFGSSNNTTITNVTKLPSELVGSSCSTDGVELVLTCLDGYTLSNDKCIKEISVNAKSNKTCKSGYHLSGSRCISDKEYTKTTTEECVKPDDDSYRVYISSNGECVADYCNEGAWEGTECTAGIGIPIDFTIVETCESGSTLISGKCRKTTSSTTTYSCETGTLQDKKCISEEVIEPTLVCPSGYIFDEECNICVLGSEV